MARVKTDALIGAALDWAVAKCEGVRLEHGLTDDERYSTEWAQGGPIIERERVEITPPTSPDDPDQTWMAAVIPCCDIGRLQTGSTPLIAAMRCYVGSKMGDEVEIPDELLHNA